MSLHWTDWPDGVHATIRRGVAIPASPLALDANRKFDPLRQRALTRYYVDAGAGGVAVGVHTTQFEIHDPKVGLLRPVLELAAETARERKSVAPVMIAGVIGKAPQAVREARLAHDLGYDLALISLAAFPRACREPRCARSAITAGRPGSSPSTAAAFPRTT